MRSVLKQYTLILFLLFSVRGIVYSQMYRYEVGGGGGIGFYLGDANPNILFKGAYPVGGIQVRYNITPRWALRGNLMGGKVYGSVESVSFKRSFADVSLRTEFNFLKYGGDLFKDRLVGRFSPFLCLGVGWMFSPPADIKYTGFTIPAGIGVKYKITERVNLISEISFYQMFTDKLDVTGKENSILNDPYNIKSNILKNKDHYFVWWVSVTWDFGYRNIYCK